MGSSCTSQTKRHFFLGTYDCTSSIVASVDVPELPAVEVSVGSATRSSRSPSSRSRSAALTTLIVLGSDIVEVSVTFTEHSSRSRSAVSRTFAKHYSRSRSAALETMLVLGSDIFEVPEVATHSVRGSIAAANTAEDTGGSSIV
jgi:hypothetical protein